MSSVRVVARIRPLLKAEQEKERIVTAESRESTDEKTTVRIPNPKNEGEAYTFQFNGVYDADATQAQLFDKEVAPTVKHLFKGLDVTLFAYGVTGTGKTHTMRGGKSLAERGVIPRLLSSIYRKARKIEKDGGGDSSVDVSMSYYEIYNDRVFDLFEAPEKRTAAGLPIRDNNGKTVVVGLTERPCTTLKEFESLYDQANVNRSTSATKLNAHSSRSHAILCVKVTQTTGEQTRVSTASAIDLAGSEDNRRTDNNKDRLVESASINKSLFVLAQCVEAISKKQHRIPYRESKMTRILSLGQNNGLTVMILNLAPVKSYHLDTISSLNFANRTKKIETNEIENQPFFRELPQGKSKLDGPSAHASGVQSINRQPLRSKILSQNSHLKDVATSVPKPAKQFAVFSDKPRPTQRPSNLANTGQARAPGAPPRSPKRPSTEMVQTLSRPAKAARTNESSNTRTMKQEVEASLSKDAIEALIERKVTEALAERADSTTMSTGDPISDEVQKRLEALEKRVQGQETERAEGLQYLLMAKQHQVRGEEVSALKMYQLALPHFPGNEKLVRKMATLQERIDAKKADKRKSDAPGSGGVALPETKQITAPGSKPIARRKALKSDDADADYHDSPSAATHQASDDEDEFQYKPRTKIRQRPHPAARSLTAPSQHHQYHAAPKHSPPPPTDNSSDEADDATSSSDELATALTAQTPRTKHLLRIINTKDVSQIKLLKGVGAKKAEAIVNCLCDLEEGDGEGGVTSLRQLGGMKGVGLRTVESMRAGMGGLGVGA
ncbi:hypothetical protein MBLNU230_g0920t1 [Neophaeotheca triangularis]